MRTCRHTPGRICLEAYPARGVLIMISTPLADMQIAITLHLPELSEVVCSTVHRFCLRFCLRCCCSGKLCRGPLRGAIIHSIRTHTDDRMYPTSLLFSHHIFPFSSRGFLYFSNSLAGPNVPSSHVAVSGFLKDLVALSFNYV